MTLSTRFLRVGHIGGAKNLHF